MGKKSKFLRALKKAFACHSEKSSKSKKRFSYDKTRESSKSKDRFSYEKTQESDPCSATKNVVESAIPVEQSRLTGAEETQKQHAYSVAIASAAAAEAAVAAAQAAAEVVRLTTAADYSGSGWKEEMAAIKIQTAFRGYVARRALRALRGLARLKTHIQGQSVKRQATTTLRCMQTLARVQSQILSRRIRMSEMNNAVQRQLLQKHELESLKAAIGEEWDDSLQSKVQVEAKLLNKQEAAIRRERAKAYAYSHQQTWRKSLRTANVMFMDPNYPQWGWSWLERWTVARAARAWESQAASETSQSDKHSLKSVSRSIGSEFSRAHARRELNMDRPSPLGQRASRCASCQSISTPPSKASSVAGKSRLASPRGRFGLEEDSRSMFSVQSERRRRHSMGGSSVLDDDSLKSSPAIPGYMASTESTRAKSRLPSPKAYKNHGTLERFSPGSAKKRLSFTASPGAQRRHSGPPRVDITKLKDGEINSVDGNNGSANNGGNM